MTEPVHYTLGLTREELAAILGIDSVDLVEAVDEYLRQFPAVAAYLERMRHEYPTGSAADDEVRDGGPGPGDLPDERPAAPPPVG